MEFNKLFIDKNYDKPINIIIKKNLVIVKSNYDWNYDEGIIDNNLLIIKFKKLGECSITKEGFIFNNNIKWTIDKRKNILFIGANDMNEIWKYKAIINSYNNGLFIEAIPDVYLKLKENLKKASEMYNGNYIGINQLVTSEKDKEYTFNIFDNNGASSSIYEPTNLALKEWKVKISKKIKLVSNTINDILSKYNWNDIKYDLFIDVQGAELEVLKGFTELNFDNINLINIEASKKEYYKNAVLYPELNKFILSKKFKLFTPEKNIKNHGDILYKKINL